MRRKAGTAPKNLPYAMAGKWWGDKNRPNTRATINPGITKSIWCLRQQVSKRSHSRKLARMAGHEHARIEDADGDDAAHPMLRMCNIRCMGEAGEGDTPRASIMRRKRRIACGAQGNSEMKSATAATAATTARSARLPLRGVLPLARLGRGGPIRIGRLPPTAVGTEPADVLTQRRLVHVEHVASAPTSRPSGVGAYEYQQEAITKSGTHFGSATAPARRWGRFARGLSASAGGRCAIHPMNDCTGSVERASTEKMLMRGAVCNRL